MKYIRSFNQIDKEDLTFAGGKGANLGEMVHAGLPVPEGFIIGTTAYYEFLETFGLGAKIAKILSENLEDPDRLMKAAQKIHQEFVALEIPEKLVTEIKAAYGLLRKGKVAVRSSATAEDLPQASFAGQQATFLNVKGDKELLKNVLLCWASLFTPRAIFYRNQNHFNHLKVGLAVVIQKMIESEVSGVMFTVDPVEHDKNIMIIEAGFGLGELIVGGKITPDQYKIQKTTIKILDKKISTQTSQMVEVKGQNLEIKVSPKFESAQKLDDRKISQLAKLGILLEKHYYFPQDVEWALEDGRIYILQTRAITTLKQNEQGEKEKVEIKKSFDLPVLVEGTSASPGIGIGHVKILKNASEIGKVKKGDILVTGMTNPDFVPAMRKATAIVTDRGGRTSHAAIVSRELGVPAVVGTEDATKVLKDGSVVTVDGSAGKVYKGSPKISKKTLSHSKPAKSQKNHKPVTKIYVNLAEPDKAKDVAKLDVDGVGLLRAEFMMAEIGIHPKFAIAQGKRADFIKKLSGGLKIFAESFHPRPVIYRGTDFKTNEYKNLKGGSSYEPVETNPLLGFRGALRFLTQPEVFEMELEAIKNVYKAGFSNLKLMIPFVRTPDELFKVKRLVEIAGLYEFSDFQLWMMAELPSNVFLLPQFLEVGIDGVSIGSNDLTMLILGADRDNEQLAKTFSEMDPAVLQALEKIIKTCKEFQIPCSICGQAPSVFDELVRKLISWGVSSISVSPDSVGRVMELVYQTELELVKVTGNGFFKGENRLNQVQI